MTYRIHLTDTWSHERMARYGPQITHAMGKVAARFPDDISLEQLACNIAEGREQLWLILDEEEEFVAFVTSEIEVTNSGKKRVLLLELGGKGGVDIADMIEPIEAWARSIGADELCPIGRIGWRKRLAAHGYYPKVIRYGKEL